VALVEARRLKVDRIQNCADAAALPSLILREPQEATAESVAPQVVRKEEEVDKQEAERGPAREAANWLLGLRIADDHRQRPTVPDPALLLVEACQPGTDRMLLLGGRSIGEADDGFEAIGIRHGRMSGLYFFACLAMIWSLILS